MKTYSQAKDLKSIAAEISRQAAAGEYQRYRETRMIPYYCKETRCWHDSVVPNVPRAAFKIGTFTVRCNDTPEAIQALIRRYAKGATKTLCTPSLASRLYAERAGYGKDYGALAVVEHETIAA